MIQRLLGAFLVLVLAAVCAVVEVLYLPLRVGQAPLPLSVLAAAVLNVTLTRAMFAVAGSFLAALLPGLTWLAVIARASIARPEGDLLITGGRSSTVLAVLNLVFLVAGSVALAFALGSLRRRSAPRWSKAAVNRQSPVSPRSIGPHRRLRTREPERSSQPPDTAGIT